MQIITSTRWALALAGLGLAMLAASVAPGSAQDSYTYGMGGPGGALFDDPCQDGDVLVGFNYTSGKAMNSIAPVCQTVRDGHIVGHDYGLNTWGKAAAGYDGAYVLRCPPDMAVYAMHVWWDKNGIVHHVRAQCHVLAGNVAGVYLKQTITFGGEASQDGVTKCPPGAFAIGMTGYYGALVDKLGLKCRVMQVADTTPPQPPPVVAPPPQQQTTTTPETPTTPQPVRRTTATATTIYDSPAGNETDYLNAGDTVTIVSCEDDGQGWCKISTPKQGYVWGGDLNP